MLHFNMVVGIKGNKALLYGGGVSSITALPLLFPDLYVALKEKFFFSFAF